MLIVVYSCKKPDPAPTPQARVKISYSGGSTIGDTMKFQCDALSGSTYLWQFGNGDTSTLAAPSYVYYKMGVYTVTLVINHSADTINNASKVLTISIGANKLHAVTNAYTWKGNYSSHDNTGMQPDTAYNMNDTTFSVTLLTDTAISMWGETLKFVRPATNAPNRTVVFAYGNAGSVNEYWSRLTYHYDTDTVAYENYTGSSHGYMIKSYHTP
ncbi:MAG: PKD domain-containing protein [Taibaiella sp.]|nr:PKD domain-containing protein [Taibaiella sp.]